MVHESFIPYSYRKTYQLTPTSANADRQLMRASWPIGMYAELEAVTITNMDASVSGGQVVFWDQDLSNTTPTARGSAGGFLLAYGIGAALASGAAGTTVQYGQENGPNTQFYGGIAMQATRLNISVFAVIRHRR